MRQIGRSRQLLLIFDRGEMVLPDSVDDAPGVAAEHDPLRRGILIEAEDHDPTVVEALAGGKREILLLEVAADLSPLSRVAPAES